MYTTSRLLISCYRLHMATVPQFSAQSRRRFRSADILLAAEAQRPCLTLASTDHGLTPVPLLHSLPCTFSLANVQIGCSTSSECRMRIGSSVCVYRFMAADSRFKWKLMVLRTFGFFACKRGACS